MQARENTAFEKMQITLIILLIFMLLLLFSMIFEKTIVNGECDNCNKFFHNFSTNCTYGLFGRTTAIIEEPEVVNTMLETEVTNNLQTNTILDKTTVLVRSDYLDNITFIGDSRFVALEKYGINKSNIFAKAGLNHNQALTWDFVELPNGNMVSLPEALQNNTNEIIIMNFGVNGAGWFTDSDFINDYHSLLDLVEDNISDDVTIVIQSILPIANSYEYKENGFPNTRIDDLNEYLIDICIERGLYYLDSSDVLKNDNNFLDTKFTNDGLHFNDLGYELLLDHMREYTIYK